MNLTDFNEVIMKALEYKQMLYERQNGICLLCKLKLNDVKSSHLDHDHALTGPNAGFCRGLLCPSCNVLEGTLLHKFNRSGLKSKTTFTAYLNNLLSYYANPLHEKIHPNFIRDKVKAVSRMNNDLIIAEIEKLTFNLPADKSKKSLISFYRKALKKSLEDVCLQS